MNPHLQQILHDITVRITKLEEAQQPQRTWVELTDEELRGFDVDPVEAKLMIAKLKEKNT